MRGVIKKQEVLIARDSAEGAWAGQEMEIYLRDGGTVTTTGTTRLSFDRCVDHFVAHGVCVECTRNNGRVVVAS